MSLSSQLAATMNSASKAASAAANNKAATPAVPPAAPTIPPSAVSARPPSLPSPPRSGAAAAAIASPRNDKNDDYDDDWWLLVVPGRTAMLAFATAAASEISSGAQPQPQPGAVFDIASLAAAHPLQALAVAAAVAAGSAAPVLRGEPHDGEAFGPFNARAERVNSAVALAGLFGLVAVEAVKGSALF